MFGFRKKNKSEEIPEYEDEYYEDEYYEDEYYEDGAPDEDEEYDKGTLDGDDLTDNINPSEEVLEKSNDFFTDGIDSIIRASGVNLDNYSPDNHANDTKDTQLEEPADTEGFEAFSVFDDTPAGSQEAAQGEEVFKDANVPSSLLGENKQTKSERETIKTYRNRHFDALRPPIPAFKNLETEGADSDADSVGGQEYVAEEVETDSVEVYDVADSENVGEVEQADEIAAFEEPYDETYDAYVEGEQANDSGAVAEYDETDNAADTGEDFAMFEDVKVTLPTEAQKEAADLAAEEPEVNEYAEPEGEDEGSVMDFILGRTEIAPNPEETEQDTVTDTVTDTVVEGVVAEETADEDVAPFEVEDSDNAKTDTSIMDEITAIVTSSQKLRSELGKDPEFLDYANRNNDSAAAETVEGVTADSVTEPETDHVEGETVESEAEQDTEVEQGAETVTEPETTETVTAETVEGEVEEGETVPDDFVEGGHFLDVIQADVDDSDGEQEIEVVGDTEIAEYVEPDTDNVFVEGVDAAEVETTETETDAAETAEDTETEAETDTADSEQADTETTDSVDTGFRRAEYIAPRDAKTTEEVSTSVHTEVVEDREIDDNFAFTDDPEKSRFAAPEPDELVGSAFANVADLDNVSGCESVNVIEPTEAEIEQAKEALYADPQAVITDGALDKINVIMYSNDEEAFKFFSTEYYKTLQGFYNKMIADEKEDNAMNNIYDNLGVSKRYAEVSDLLADKYMS